MVRLLYPRDCRYRALLSTHLFVVSTHIETLTLRLSSVAFTLIMTSPCFITPTVVVLLEKEGVTSLMSLMTVTGMYGEAMENDR